MRLEDKVAIVTGAASGFGEGIARRFAAEGAKVVLADLNDQAGRRIAAEIEAAGGAAAYVHADVTDSTQVKAMIGTAVERFGRLDILVNNAGVSHLRQPMIEVSEADFDRTFAVNVKAIYLAAIEVVPLFRTQGAGCIVNISSTAGLSPRAGLTWYNGSKGAVNTITKSMAVELAPDRIRVNAICPVAGATPLLATFMGKPDTPENRAPFLATIPLGRLSTPEDIANAALYLASDEASMLTGVLLQVDGGRCI
ncbi:MAG: glucose 1-dehydrogenase [Proteobacteria bacterium]|nr:glucose 1-dehydrogenase [Pseudomonadota bacterium]